MKYNAKYFKENFPEWKRKKDSILVRHFFRPISFFTASIAARKGIGANAVSYFSLIVAIVGSICYIPKVTWIHILGAIIMWFWMVLDCTDGNIARTIRKEPFGEFADASSSYVFINFLFFGLGVAAFKCNGLLISSGKWWLLVLGGFTGASDTLARLLYQKFENVKRIETESLKDITLTNSRGGNLNRIHDRIDKELGQNGLFLPALLICSIKSWFDVFILFYSIFYISTLCLSSVLLVRKTKQIYGENNGNQ